MLLKVVTFVLIMIARIIFKHVFTVRGVYYVCRWRIESGMLSY